MIICSGTSALARVQAKLMHQRKPRVKQLKRRRAFFFLCSHLRVPKGFPNSSVGKESACNAGDPSSIPGSGRSTGEGIGYPIQYSWASLAAQLVKNPPAMQETWVQSLGWEDPWRRERLPTSGYPVFWPGEFRGLLCSFHFQERPRGAIEQLLKI